MTTASVIIILRKKPNKDGTYALALQITKDRKKSITHLGQDIKMSDWDAVKRRVKKSHPNSERLNNFLLQKLADANDTILNIETGKKHVSAQTMKKTVVPQMGATFLVQAQEYLNDLKTAGNYNQYTADKPRIGHFKTFLQNRDIAFSDLTPGLLDKFVVYLKSSHLAIEKKKPMGERTIVNHLAAIRSVFAYSRKQKVVTKEQSPFGGDGGIKIKFPDSKKIGISAEDFHKLEELSLEDAKYEHARKMWLFSFYFAGMRISDQLRLRWSDFNSYRLHYSMGKNDKVDSLKIPEQAVNILKHYEQFKENESDFVFPELKGANHYDEFLLKRTIAFKTSALDKVLRKHVAPAAGITSTLTMHITRHTFASIAGDVIPPQMLQKLYRHSHISTTIGYQANFIHQAADDALDAVINKTRSTSNPN